MESIIFFKYDSALQLIRTHSVDSMAILPFLEGRDFKITSVHSLEDGVTAEKCDFEQEWITRDHFIYINALKELDDELKNGLAFIEIELENKGYISYSLGQLELRMEHYEVLRSLSIQLLKFYGFYAAEELWKELVNHQIEIPIYFVLGMSEKDFLTTKNRMLEEAYSVDSTFTAIEGKLRFVSFWPNQSIKEVGFEENGQLIDEWNCFCPNGELKVSSTWMYDEEDVSFMYALTYHCVNAKEFLNQHKGEFKSF